MPWLQVTPASAISIAFTSAPMSRPSVAEPSAGEGFLQEAPSFSLRQSVYGPIPGSCTSRMPAAPTSLGVILPEGHLEPPIIRLLVKLEFAKQLFSTPPGPCRSGSRAQFLSPPPLLPLSRSPPHEKILFFTLKISIFSPGLPIETIARGTKAVTCSICTSPRGGAT